jgi:hypothetical protein
VSLGNLLTFMGPLECLCVGTDARQVQPEMKAGLVKQREKFIMMFKDFRDVFTLRFNLRKIDTQELCDPASTFFTPSFKLLAQQLIWYRVNTLPLEQQVDIAKDEFIHAMEMLVPYLLAVFIMLHPIRKPKDVNV